MRPHSQTRVRLPFWLKLICALFFFAGWGCDDSEQTETAMFEKAELNYRLGNYDDAVLGYQAFLREYPTSPLTRTVEMRIRTIHREVASVLNRPGMPRPVYHGSSLKESGSMSVEAPSEEVEPQESTDADDSNKDDALPLLP